MKQILLVLCLQTLLCFNLQSQWEKRPIVENEFKDSEVPQWAFINGDHLNDLVGYDDDNHTLFWRKNEGTQLGAPIVIATDLPLQKGNYQILDWEEDGDMDIVTHTEFALGNDQIFRLFLNNGNGTFLDSDIEVYTEQWAPDFSLFADINHDGSQDLIIKHTGRFHIYPNENGAYNYSGEKIDGSFRAQIYVEDLNQDGNQQIVVVKDDFVIYVYDFSNNEVTETTTIHSDYPGSPDYSVQSALQFKDFDNDGDIDITRKILDADIDIVIDVGQVIYKENYFYNYYQDSNGEFVSERFYTSVSTGEIPHTIHQNKLDASYTYIIYDPQIKIWDVNQSTFDFNQVSGSIETIPSILVGTLGSTCIFQTNAEQLYTIKRNGSVYDINIAYQSAVPGEIFSWQNCLNCSPIEFYDDVEAADLDGDGDLDIIVSSVKNDNQVLWFENFRSGCHFENINPILGDYFGPYTEILQVESADFDNDGDNDLVIMKDIDSSDIFILENDGAGNFSQPVFLTNIPFAFDLQVEDIYNDGFAEIILHTGEFSFTSQDPTTFTVSILENTNGIENFNQVVIQNSTDRGKMEFADMDNDGDKDLVVYNEDSLFDNIVIYSNDGSQLIQTQIHEDFIDMYSMDVFDYNLDGFPEIIALHDGLSNNNIETVYSYQNNQGNIDWANPTFLFENVDRYQHYGIHNQDMTIGFVGKDGFGSWSVLSYYNQSGIADTLDSTEPILYLLADLNNDGYEDIINANSKGALDFYTRGLIDCSPPCVPETEGYLFFQDCGGIEFFVIETDEGELLDPYFADGVQFAYYDGMYVRFSYTNLGIATPCEDAVTVEIQCIEERLHIPSFTDYDWLPEFISESDGCCEIEKIESFYNINTRYIYITPRSDCPEYRERLYSEDKVLQCIEPDVFVGQCIADFGLDTLTRKLLWECDPVSNDEIHNDIELILYPNPAHDELNIETAFKGKFSIFDAHGKCLRRSETISNKVDIQRLQTGVYFISFENEETVFTRKFVKL